MRSELTDYDDFRIDLRITIPSTIVAWVAFSGGAPKFLRFIGAFAVIAAVLGGARAYYSGTTILYRHLSARWRTPYQVFVVTVAWAAMCLIYAQGADLGRLSMSGRDTLVLAGFTAVIGWFGYAAVSTSTSPMRPAKRLAMRPCLVMIAAVGALCTFTRSGQSLSSGDDHDGSYSAPSTGPTRSPETRADRALLHYILYSGGGIAGVLLGLNGGRTHDDMESILEAYRADMLRGPRDTPNS